MEKKTFNIGVELDADFVDMLEGLMTAFDPKTGTKLAQLNGFAPEQLGYTAFIDKYLANDTVADASIDGNSNVHHHDVVTLEHEMIKPHEKLLSFNKIFYEIKKKFGVAAARYWLYDEWVGHLYMHDGYNASLKSYCLRGDTEFVTSEGVKTLKEMCGKDVTVLNKNGGWEHGVVKCFGEGELYKITMNYMGGTKTVYATGNHRWFLYNTSSCGKSVVETTDLKPGDRIPRVNDKAWAHTNISSFGVAHGFFTGDGYKNGNRANFCGDKIALLPYFQPCKVRGNEREYTVGGCPNYFSELPPITENKSYLYGWLAGFFAADGCMDKTGKTCVLTSCNYEYIKFARDVVAKLGMPVYDIRTQHRKSNLTNEWGDVYYLTLDKSCLCDEFFIRPRHKEGFENWKNRKKTKPYWIINSVERTGVVEPVYCVETDNTGSFTLTGGVLTHNCFAFDVDAVARKGLFFLENYNAEPPKHFTTFNQMVVETVSYLSNRQAGAVGLPSYLIWAWWFWWVDCQNGYYIREPGYYRDQCLQEIIYRLNQPFLRNSIESAFTNFSIFDRPYFEAFFGDLVFPDGTLAIDHEEDIIQFEKDFMRLEAEIRSANMMTYPVLSFSLQRVGGKFVDEEFARWACEFNMLWTDSNFLVTEEITSAASCCRLLSDISVVDKDVPLGVCNSIGGTSLNVGSVKVNTINLAGLSYETRDTDAFLNEVYEQTWVACQALDAQRNIIRRNIEKGLLPNFSSGLIHMERMFSTVGIIGLYEACEHFGLIGQDEFGYVHYTDEARELGTKVFETIHKAQDDFKRQYEIEYQFNVEQIPAERAAVVLKEKDQLFYPNEKYTLPAYGNQFVPLGIKTTMQERVEVDGLYDQACNSGCILHFNLDAPLKSAETAWELMNYICDQGVTYFAFVTRISACKENHGFYGDVCPICGGPKETEYTKIVGFLTPVKSWSKERKAEFKLRDWMDLNGMEDLQ